MDTVVSSLLYNHRMIININMVFKKISDELGINKDRYKSLADEMDSTFAELAGY